MTAGTKLDNVLLTYDVVGEAKQRRLRTLAEKINLSVVADSAVVVDGLPKRWPAPSAL